MAAPIALFDYTNAQLQVSFLNNSTGDSLTYSWNFGDGTSLSTDKNPVHSFGSPGFYSVTLSVSTGGDTPETASFSRIVGVTTLTSECTQTPVYTSVMARIPEAFKEILPASTILDLIKKWQVYLKDLLDTPIPSQYVHNELYWPILANELVIELVLLDIFDGNIKNYLMSLVTSQTTASSSSSSSEGQSLKRVVTGPAEAEWYDSKEAASSQLSSIVKPGGFVEQSKNQACILAGRLKISLFICPELQKPVFPPTIVRKHPRHGRTY